jgi:transcriptional regulator with GAF, ATPase, and Fis domain
LGGKSSIDSTISSAAIEDIVKDMNQHFERAMLLLFHNSELKVWKASDRWEQDKTRDTNIDLSIPSVFRIVKETKLPYHGHVVGNPINDAFFMTWSKGKTPEHLTIVPVLYEKNLIGMLLGATTKERASQISLERVQGLGLEAGLTLISQAAA